VFDWLIVMLGGVSKSQFDQALEGWRARALAAETTVSLFNDIIARERERSDRIEQDIRERAFPAPAPKQKPPQAKPIGSTISSWPRIKRELEKRDRIPTNQAPTAGEVHESLFEADHA
jgi:hypothetical protein